MSAKTEFFIVAVQTDGSARSRWSFSEAIESATSGKVLHARLGDFCYDTQEALMRALEEEEE